MGVASREVDRSERGEVTTESVWRSDRQLLASTGI